MVAVTQTRKNGAPFPQHRAQHSSAAAVLLCCCAVLLCCHAVTPAQHTSRISSRHHDVQTFFVTEREFHKIKVVLPIRKSVDVIIAWVLKDFQSQAAVATTSDGVSISLKFSRKKNILQGTNHANTCPRTRITGTVSPVAAFPDP